jgi:GrpB-like predicted nucleotidyltransferase (UPF0157 family)
MPRKVDVVAYDPAWPELFCAEAKRLRRVFGAELLVIHHMGSTAVPGLSAKPIIDLLAEVRDLDRVDGFNDALRALGYEPRGEHGIPGRRFFPRRLGDEADTRTHHLHVYQGGHAEITRHLALRDYLCAHPEAARVYAQLKEDLARRCPWDIDSYIAGKDAFIKDLEQQALAWAAAHVS